jgi:hypothetical protein
MGYLPNFFQLLQQESYVNRLSIDLSNNRLKTIDLLVLVQK